MQGPESGPRPPGGTCQAGTWLWPPETAGRHREARSAVGFVGRLAPQHPLPPLQAMNTLHELQFAREFKQAMQEASSRAAPGPPIPDALPPGAEPARGAPSPARRPRRQPQFSPRGKSRAPERQCMGFPGLKDRAPQPGSEPQAGILAVPEAGAPDPRLAGPRLLQKPAGEVPSSWVLLARRPSGFCLRLHRVSLVPISLLRTLSPGELGATPLTSL